MGIADFATYDIFTSYYDNFERGPKFKGSFPYLENLKREEFDFLGLKIDFPLGIPAGLLLNSKWVKFYADMGFPLLVYKTVRTLEYPSHPYPNCLFVKTEMLDPFKLPEVLFAPSGYEPPSLRVVTITNSFGMPSMKPEWWQEDMEKAKSSLPEGYALIGSGVGTYEGERGKLVRDFVDVAVMLKEVGVAAIILNFSCPNVEGSEGLIYTDYDLSGEIVSKVKKAVPDVPLFVKVGFLYGKELKLFIKAVAAYVDGVAGINSIQAKVIKEDGTPALGADREKSGVCGWAIRECAKLFTRELYRIREELKADFLIMSCGGVTDKASFLELKNCGADIVLSCTGAMFNPLLASEIRE